MTNTAMSVSVSHQVWNYIRTLGVDRDTAYDLYQEAQAAVWEASTQRATRECQAYLVKTAIGAIRHWLRDKYCLIRIPAYLHDRGEVAEHTKIILPLDDFTDSGDGVFDEDLIEELSMKQRRSELMQLLPYLSRAERKVMEGLLAGQNIRDIARNRRVRVGCVYAQRSRAIDKLRRMLKAAVKPDLPSEIPIDKSGSSRVSQTMQLRELPRIEGRKFIFSRGKETKSQVRVGKINYGDMPKEDEKMAGNNIPKITLLDLSRLHAISKLVSRTGWPIKTEQVKEALPGVTDANVCFFLGKLKKAGLIAPAGAKGSYQAGKAEEVILSNYGSQENKTKLQLGAVYSVSDLLKYDPNGSGPAPVLLVPAPDDSKKAGPGPKKKGLSLRGPSRPAAPEEKKETAAPPQAVESLHRPAIAVLQKRLEEIDGETKLLGLEKADIEQAIELLEAA